MTTSLGKFGLALAGLVLAMGFDLLAGAAPALAQGLEQQIEDALKPKPQPFLTRGLGAPTRSLNDPKSDARAADEQQFINRLRTRSIAVEPTGPGQAAPPAPAIAAEDRAKIVEIVKEKPKIDLEIYFDYNSAVISPRAVPQLVALGNVLSKADYKGTVFFINGHTDAAGTPEYNHGLSQRRADSVRRMLIEQYKLAPDTLIAVGFGKEQLKDPANPMADQNRRVQIVNTEMKAAGR